MTSIPTRSDDPVTARSLASSGLGGTAKQWLGAAAGHVSRAATNGPAWSRKLAAFILDCLDDRRVLATRHGGFSLRVGNPIERWRAETLLTKEPETIRWLERTIAEDSVFYDVGANIGLYTLFACHLYSESVRAVCFEPEGLNFARLSRNLHDNGLSERVLAFPIGLGDEDGVGAFHLSEIGAGRALHNAGTASAAGSPHRQGIVVKRLDDLLRGQALLPPPTHLKVDVDGPEHAVFLGAAETLALPELRHVLAEIADPHAEPVAAMLNAAGFRLIETGAHAGDGANYVFEKT